MTELGFTWNIIGPVALVLIGVVVLAIVGLIVFLFMSNRED